MDLQPPGSSLVTPDWLAERLHHPDLVVLDASVGAHRGAAERIPGARVFDIDGTMSDTTSPLPHTMPDLNAFARSLRALGLHDHSVVVAYDAAGLYSSARAWWMLRVAGFDRAAVLDGGLPAWKAGGLGCEPASASTVPTAAGDFIAKPRPELLADSVTVTAALSDGASAVLDARSRERYAGQVTEPRPGLRRGHMPGAVNLPFTDLQVDGRMRASDELHALFSAAAGPRERLVFSCGSGVTACVLALGADLAGYHDLAVYDGSWSEWGLPSDFPVETTDLAIS
ncbi:sulfurtransferase [Streptomyces sp. NPDC096079]|uniref:sulfurtransferase n=1 Tax=Streptomyces sp. NPDC096079 TaxID=3155820 RepID=UPI0033181319